jgi:hypothetical protein
VSSRKFAQIIEMARHYQCKPSQILNIDDDYESYCVDEVAFFYVVNAKRDKNGNIKWDSLRWLDGKKNDTKAFMDFLTKGR